MTEPNLSFEDVCSIFEIASKDGSLNETKLIGLHQWYSERNKEEQQILDKEYYFVVMRMLGAIKNDRFGYLKQIKKKKR